MNKGDLVSQVSKIVGSKKTAEAAVNCMLGFIPGTLKKGHKVTLIGFGTFSVVKKAARTGTNPRTGKPLKIAAKKVPRFVAGKALKDSVKK